MSKLRLIVEEWRNVASAKRRGFIKLERIINLKLIKSTLFLINSVSETRKYVTQRQNILYKATKTSYLLK